MKNIHLDVVGERSVLQMGERSKHIQVTAEVQSGSQVNFGALPEGQESVCRRVLLVDLHTDRVHGDTVESKVLGWHVRGQTVLVAAEELIDESVPTVEYRVTHSRGNISHHAELFQIAVLLQRLNCGLVNMISLLKENKIIPTGSWE